MITLSDERIDSILEALLDAGAAESYAELWRHLVALSPHAALRALEEVPSGSEWLLECIRPDDLFPILEDRDHRIRLGGVCQMRRVGKVLNPPRIR